MDIKRKTEIAEQAVASISRHDDEDAMVRKASLNRVIDFVHAEIQAIDDRNAARVAALFAEPKE